MKYVVRKENAPLYEKRPEHSEKDKKYPKESDELIYGTSVDALEEKGDWVLVRTFYQYEGWIKKEDLLAREYWMEGKRLAIISGWYADVLTEPDIKSFRIASIPKGGFVVLLAEEANGFHLVRLWDGQKGYIREAFLKLWYFREWKGRGYNSSREETRLRMELTETAESYLGIPYRFAGKSIFGIDCSGFCFMVYLLHGVIIYRDSSIQKGFPVREIPLKMVRPGDLLYYPGHMALYLGNSFYIHSTLREGSEGVVVNSLNKEKDCYREDLSKPRAGSIF